MSEFNGFEGNCVLEEVENVDVMNDVEHDKNIGEKFRGEEGKRKRPDYQSQAGFKKMKNEEEDPEITCIDDLPNELLQLILKKLETKDVMTAGQTCRRWFSVRDRICQQKAQMIETSWKRRNYFPDSAEVTTAVLLAEHGHLLLQVITTKSVEIEASWYNDDYTPSPAEVHCASSLADHGHLPRQVISNMAAKKAESLYCPSLAQVQCDAALATLGYITQVESQLMLHDMDTSLVPAEDLSSLVKCWVDVTIVRVTGDLSPVLCSLRCRGLTIFNTMLSTADTQQLVAAMDTRVEWVVLCDGVTLDMETLAQYDGKGDCKEVILSDDTKERYRDQVKAWAENIGWQTENSSYALKFKRE